MKDKLPPLAHMSTVLRFGMSRDEFFAACDDLMEHYTLRVGSPTLDMNLVSIAVAEGDSLLCFLNEAGLSYVEYRGDEFIGEDLPRAPAAYVPPARAPGRWVVGVTLLVLLFGGLLALVLGGLAVWGAL